MPNPTLKRVPPQALPEPLREAHARSMALRGDATFFEVFGNHPALYDWYANSFYGNVFHGGKVPRRIKELCRLRLSTVHGCRFCNQGNREDALAAGLSDRDIDAVGNYVDSHLAPAEKAALKLADTLLLTNQNGVLTRELYGELAEHFDDGEILELGLTLGILSGVAKFLFAFDLVEKESHCPFTAPGA